MMAERDANLKRQMDSIEKLTPDMPNYQEELEKQIEDFVLTVPIQNRTSLTKYVARRKMVLNIFDNILEKEKVLAKMEVILMKKFYMTYSFNRNRPQLL